MHPVIYDVAVSIDGYICGPGGNVSQFPDQGPVVEDYRDRLLGYSCAIMGRKTYEFGYRFGMARGANPYPHMRTFVFSQKIDIPSQSDIEIVRDSVERVFQGLRQQQTGPIYLCGGGHFAGSLLSAGLIDVIRLKRAPILLGRGTALFENAAMSENIVCTKTKLYDAGYLFQEYKVL